MSSVPSVERPIVLHLGDEIEYNLDLFNEQLLSSYTITRPPLDELTRPEFMRALTEKRWGNFSALMRPFWNTGGEMGHWDRELISLLPKSCKVFASAGTGYDWADVEILAEHGILYCNGATASTEAVADCSLWHLLSTFRNFTESSSAARSGSTIEFLNAHKYLTPKSHNPRGHTLGIIGLGNIGCKIAEKSIAAFGMKIVYTDIDRKYKAEEKLPAQYYESLERMVSECDAVVLATPSLPKSATTTYLLTADIFSRFKKGSRFINIARGSLVDSNALADALESNHIAAAGLDVFEDEPRINERLLNMSNVEMTCHNGGGAEETWMKFEELAIRNVHLVLNGEEPLTAVNRHFFAPGYTKIFEGTKSDNTKKIRSEETEAEETKDDTKEAKKEKRARGRGLPKKWRLWSW